MTTRYKPLVLSKYAPAVDTAEYTAAAGIRTMIDKLTAYNGSANTAYLTVRIVPSGATSDASHTMAYRVLAANEATTLPEVVGHAIEAGGSLNFLASAASAIVIRVTGRESS
jgi:hypothetical protein